MAIAICREAICRSPVRGTERSGGTEPNPATASPFSHCQLRHLLPHTERPHVHPHLFDVRQHLLLRPHVPLLQPALRDLEVRVPQRVLHLMIDQCTELALPCRVMDIDGPAICGRHGAREKK
eukprot:EG_transcript_31688